MTAPDGSVSGGRSRTALLVRVGWSEEYSPLQLLLVAVLAVAPTAFVICLSLAGAHLSWWLLVLSPLGVALAPRTESVLVLMAWLALGTLWLALVPGPFSWWCLPAALVVLTAHTALTVLSGRPTAGGFATETGPRTRRRMAVVGGATLAVALVCRVTLGLGVSGQAAIIALALAALAAWWWWGRRKQV